MNQIEEVIAEMHIRADETNNDVERVFLRSFANRLSSALAEKALVPRDLTEEMRDAAIRADAADGDYMRAEYEAMLAVADPLPPHAPKG